MSQPNLLTPKQVKAIRNLCIGLHMEMGSSFRQEHLRCYKESETKRKVTRQGKVVVSFPTDQAADKWNKELEKRIRHLGHLGTAIVTVIVTLVTKNPAYGIGAGTGTGIAKDEIQASIEYPYARRGWRIEVLSTTTYEQNALGKDYIVFSYEYVGYDHKGVKQYQKKGLLGGRIEVGEEMNRIPKDVALQMVARSSETRHVTYK